LAPADGDEMLDRLKAPATGRHGYAIAKRVEVLETSSRPGARTHNSR
jgi:hypothetical protein